MALQRINEFLYLEVLKQKEMVERIPTSGIGNRGNRNRNLLIL